MFYQKTNLRPFVQTEYSLLSSQILSSGPNFDPPFYCHIQKGSFHQNFRNKIFLNFHEEFCQLYLQTICFLYRNFLLLRHYVCLFSCHYNPLWLYFHSPVAGFSVLVFEVS